ncbi:MAG: HD domain-containing phosphohydrolase [Eubacteriales bacterium]
MISEESKKILEINYALTAEKDREALLEHILSATMEMTNCDAGTLYIATDEELIFKVMITKSLGILKGARHEPINLPPIPISKENVCAYTVLEKKITNIPDVYHSDLFNFEGPIRYDRLTGYKTISMLTVPMENNFGEIIGVMQLINSQDEAGEIIPFSEDSELVALSLGAQAAVCLTNMNYTKQLEELMQSMVKTISTAINLRSPYNVTHTNNMVFYAKHFMEWANQKEDCEWKFSEFDQSLLEMTIWLHDIGKLITPLEIMNKATRLGAHYEKIIERFELILLCEELHAIKEGTDTVALQKEQQETLEFIEHMNTIGYLEDDNYARVQELAHKTYRDGKGKVQKWFLEEEIACLSIRKGTLTEEERVTMQEHVILTEQLLAKMKFNGRYQNVPLWARSHHELLDGSGYPKKLTDHEIEREVRLLTILDIYDGLSSTDRPYKAGFSLKKSLEILESMADEKKLDKTILDLFQASEPWNAKGREDFSTILSNLI